MNAMHLLRLPIGAFLIFTFVLSGTILCLVGFLLHILLYNRHRRLYRLLIDSLAYSFYSQVVCLATWWSGSELEFIGDHSFVDNIGREHAIVVMNHRLEIDWLLGWMVLERSGCLGGAKYFGKRELRNLPVFGWMSRLTESIFLARNFDKDRDAIEKGVAALSCYPQPVVLLLMCEGTRFTEEKHARSREFAERENLPRLRHHLTPRTKGFVQTVEAVKKIDDAGSGGGDGFRYIYDCTVAIDLQRSRRPTFVGLLFFGERFYAQLHAERLPMPDPDDGSAASWLHSRYEKKDALFEEFVRKGSFPIGEGQVRRKLDRRWRPLVNLALWNVVSALLSLKAWSIVALMSWLQLGGVLAAVVSVAGLVVFAMLRMTMVSRSSAYGRQSTATAESKSQ